MDRPDVEVMDTGELIEYRDELYDEIGSMEAMDESTDEVNPRYQFLSTMLNLVNSRLVGK